MTNEEKEQLKAWFMGVMDQHERSEERQIARAMTKHAKLEKAQITAALQATVNECRGLHKELKSELSNRLSEYADELKTHGDSIDDLKEHVTATYENFVRAKDTIDAINKAFDATDKKLSYITHWIKTGQMLAE